MVLIISEKSDYNTGVVINWLCKSKVRYILITPETKVKEININLNEDDYTIKFQQKRKIFEVNYKDIDSVWYRRGFINVNIEKNSIKDAKIKKSIGKHLLGEWASLLQFIYNSFGNKIFLGNYLIGDTNKIITLKIAKKVGLLTPETHVLTKKEDVINLLSKKEYITKGIQSGLLINIYNKDNQISYYNLTNEINKSDFKESETTFFPSLIQQKIKKLFEIRTFFINNVFYSMAIFSQLDNQTKIDFRNYNFKKSNRCIPFTLPSEIRKKLIKLLNILHLNTASIDIIYTPNKKYYFLEINPIGQYEMVSSPCNYNIDKRIYEFLTSNN